MKPDPYAIFHWTVTRSGAAMTVRGLNQKGERVKETGIIEIFVKPDTPDFATAMRVGAPNFHLYFAGSEPLQSTTLER